MRLLLLLVIALPLLAQKPTFTDITAHVSRTTALIKWSQASTGTAARACVDYGPTTGLDNRTICQTVQHASHQPRAMAIGGLSPNTLYYFRPLGSDPTATAVTADAGTDVITLNSHGLSDGDMVQFSGGTTPGGLSTTLVYYVRDSDTNTFKVALTRGGAAIDLTTNGSSPTLFRYNGTFVCADNTALGDATCVTGELPRFTTANLPIQDPALPETWSTSYPTINGSTFNVSVSGGLCTDLSTQLTAAAAADVNLNHEVVIPAGATCRGVVSLPNKADGTGVVVVRSSAIGSALLPAEGVRVLPEHAAHMATLERPAAPESSGFTVSDTNWAHLSGSGSSHGWRFSGIRFTVRDHADYERVEINVTGVSGNTISFDADHLQRGLDVVCIAEVGGVANANQCAAVGSIPTSSSLTLSGVTLSGTYTSGGYLVNAPSTAITSCTTGPPAVCTTANKHGLTNASGRIVAVGGSTGVNGTWHYNVLTSTTLELTGATGPSTGGFLVQDNERLLQTINTDRGMNGGTYNNVQRWIFDRCIFDGGGFPVRQSNALQLLGDYMAVIDSHFQGYTNWRGINPTDGTRVTSASGGFSEPAMSLILLSAGTHKVIKNNRFADHHGIPIFAEETAQASNEVISDISITDNDFSADLDMLAGLNQSTTYYTRRHIIEFKQGRKILIARNILDGAWVDAVPRSPAVFFSIRRSNRGACIEDVTVRDNVFTRLGTAVQIEGQDNIPANSSTITGDCYTATRRVLVENNLIYQSDARVWRSNPRGSGTTNGPAFLVQWPTEDVRFIGNTIYDNRGSAPRFVETNNAWTGIAEIKDNLLWHNHDNSTGGLHAGTVESSRPNSTPSNTLAGFNLHNPTLTWARNYVVPGVTNSNGSASYEDPWPNQYTTANCSSYWDTAATCVDGANVTARIAAVSWYDPTTGDFRLRYDSPYRNVVAGTPAGADVREIKRLISGPQNVRRLGTTVYFKAPSASSSCYVEHASSDFPAEGVTPTRITATGATRQKSAANITGAYWRVSCAVN